MKKFFVLIFILMVCLFTFAGESLLYFDSSEVSMDFSIKNVVMYSVGLVILMLVVFALTKIINKLTRWKKVLSGKNDNMSEFLKCIVDVLIELFMTILTVVKELENTKRKAVIGPLSDGQKKELHNTAFNEVYKRNKTVRTLVNVFGKANVDTAVSNGIHSVVKHLKLFRVFG